MNVRSNIDPLWASKINNGMKIALLDMATDIHRRAVVIAPKDSRALVNSGKIEPITDGYKIKFGSDRVPYARRRHFENKLHPGTKGYLSKAGDSVARSDKSKYFKGRI